MDGLSLGSIADRPGIDHKATQCQYPLFMDSLYNVLFSQYPELLLLMIEIRSWSSQGILFCVSKKFCPFSYSKSLYFMLRSMVFNIKTMRRSLNLFIEFKE